MSKKQSRRRVPVSAVTMVAVLILVFFEVLVIGGVFSVKASTVARIAPWAYEPFLRLVGEHPESERLQARSRKEQGVDASSGMASIAGLNTEGVIIELGAPVDEGGEVSPDAERSPESATNTVPEGASVTNPVPERSGEVVPVG